MRRWYSVARVNKEKKKILNSYFVDWYNDLYEEKNDMINEIYETYSLDDSINLGIIINSLWLSLAPRLVNLAIKPPNDMQFKDEE